jgi:hypothetical protein
MRAVYIDRAKHTFETCIGGWFASEKLNKINAISSGTQLALGEGGQARGRDWAGG